MKAALCLINLDLWKTQNLVLIFLHHQGLAPVLQSGFGKNQVPSSCYPSYLKEHEAGDLERMRGLFTCRGTLRPETTASRHSSCQLSTTPPHPLSSSAHSSHRSDVHLECLEFVPDVGVLLSTMP